MTVRELLEKFTYGNLVRIVNNKTQDFIVPLDWVENVLAIRNSVLDEEVVLLDMGVDHLIVEV